MSDLPLGRLYESDGQLDTVLRILTEQGLQEEAWSRVSPAGREHQSIDDIASDIADGYSKWLPPNHASAYAEKVKAGSSLLLVDAPFGRGGQIQRVLDEHNPMSISLPAPPKEPLGSTPFSDYLGLKTLKQGRTFGSKDGGFMGWLFGESSQRRFFVFGGMSMISNKAAPLSSLFGLRTLSDNPDPGDKSFGLPLKIDNATPLSSKIGAPVLKNSDKTESFIGLPVKSDDPTPFSSALGLSVLTKSDSDSSK